MIENTPKKVDDRKPLKLPPVVHREIKMEAAATGKTMQDLIDEAWQAYKRSRTQTGVQHFPDTVQNPPAIESPHYGDAGQVARRAARVVELLAEAQALLGQAAAADSGRADRSGKHPPRKRAGGQ